MKILIRHDMMQAVSDLGLQRKEARLMWVKLCAEEFEKVHVLSKRRPVTGFNEKSQ